MNRNFLREILTNGILIYLLALLPGCGLMPKIPSVEKSVTIRERVEELFLRQNHAASEVMMLSVEELDFSDFDQLKETELEMQEACELLNEYAVRSRDQLSLGLLLQRRVYSSIDECDEATKIVESLLQELNTNATAEQMKNKQTEAD